MMANAEIIGLPILNRTFDRLGKIGGGPAARRVVGAGAKVVQDAARANVRAKLNRNSSGRLEADIATVFENDREATVGPRTVIYARIHEYGGIITPQRARVLAFEVDGKMIFARRVTIPARPYMRPAYDSKRRAAQEAMSKQVDAEILTAVKG